MVYLRHVLILTISWTALTTGDVDMWDKLKLPTEHIPYYFHNNQDIQRQCLEDDSCPYKYLANVEKCWGYEDGCAVAYRMKTPRCEPDEWVKRGKRDISTVIQNFWKEADFGYVKKRRDELKTYCEALNEGDSSLECSDHTRFCRSKNLYIDFRRHSTFGGYNRYREDMFEEGEIGGHCKLNKDLLSAAGKHKSPLQSWFAELEQFSSLDFKPLDDGHCDIIIDKPSFFIKLDAGVNMYHHYCDFVNLYMSQHVNNSFSTDVYIFNYDTSPMNYGDFFSDTWNAFSDYPMRYLREFAGKRVCFKQAVFSLLARMQYGLFYNTPLTPNCNGSSLFRAFSQHTVHRLGIPQQGPLPVKIRITLLARSTKHRNILNQDELVSALKTVGEFDVKMVDFTRSQNYPFLEQVDIMHNTDIFIGIHGAGLTHLLFQPDWGVVFEIYNCEDPSCYKDLARLRGLLYMTWEKPDKLHQEDEGHHPTLGAHAKFTNYGFDVNEFMRLIFKAADYVRSHKDFVQERSRMGEMLSSKRDEL